MPGFDRKELRGKLALAITANFKNYYSRDEAAVEEISGVAFIFNQKFFKVHHKMLHVNVVSLSTLLVPGFEMSAVFNIIVFTVGYENTKG